MWYGLQSATSISDPDATMIFWDHFDYTWASQTKWTGDTSYASVANSILSMTGNGSGTFVKTLISIARALRNSYAVAFNGKLTLESTDYIAMGAQHGKPAPAAAADVQGQALLYGNLTAAKFATKNWATQTETAVAWTSGAFKNREILVAGGVNTRVFEEGCELVAPITTTVPDSIGAGATIGAYRSISICQLDWIYLRAYEVEEPTILYWDAEVLLEINVNLDAVGLELAAYDPTFEFGHFVFLESMALFFEAHGFTMAHVGKVISSLRISVLKPRCNSIARGPAETLLTAIAPGAITGASKPHGIQAGGIKPSATITTAEDD